MSLLNPLVPSSWVVCLIQGTGPITPQYDTDDNLLSFLSFYEAQAYAQALAASFPSYGLIVIIPFYWQQYGTGS